MQKCGSKVNRNVKLATELMALLIDDMLSLSGLSCSEFNICRVNLKIIAQQIADNFPVNKTG